MADKKQNTLTPEQEEKLFPTKWTSTQPNPRGYMIKAYDLAPANVPGQRVTGFLRDGRRRVEASVPHLEYEKWIDEAGNVRAVPMATTRAETNGKNIDSEGIYRMQMRNECYRSGWVHYEKGDGAPADFRANWPARRDDLIAFLQDEQRVAMEEADRRNANQAQSEELKREAAALVASKAKK